MRHIVFFSIDVIKVKKIDVIIVKTKPTGANVIDTKTL